MLPTQLNPTQTDVSSLSTDSRNPNSTQTHHLNQTNPIVFRGGWSPFFSKSFQFFSHFISSHHHHYHPLRYSPNTFSIARHLFLSMTKTSLWVSTFSNVLTTFIKLLAAPFSCLNRAIDNGEAVRDRPFSKTVWRLQVNVTGLMWRTKIYYIC